MDRAVVHQAGRLARADERQREILTEQIEQGANGFAATAALGIVPGPVLDLAATAGQFVR